ncbi:MAG: alpha/beta hydrolase [Candidatus Rokubacteria bacterium]|nr:alpha/beta hydrolase [Candidatus Rokubacteria bacterium]
MAAELAGVEVEEIVLPEDHDMVVHGMRLHYLDWGTRGCCPIVFLHGGALNAHTWDVVCLTLRPGYHCIALDQRGHGDSAWSPEMDYGPEAHLRDIEGFVERLGLDHFVLVGHSMGGLHAFLYAARHSGRLAGLALVDVGPDVRVDGAERIHRFVSQTAEVSSLDEAVQRALAFNPRRHPRLLRRSLLYNFRRLPDGRWTRKHDPRHWTGRGAADIAAQAREWWKDPERVSCPTLILRGAVSDVFHDEDAERFARALPNGRWVRVEDAGHTVQGDNPRGLAEALANFLRGIS